MAQLEYIYSIGTNHICCKALINYFLSQKTVDDLVTKLVNGLVRWASFSQVKYSFFSFLYHLFAAII
jgi:hypothetical protein